MTTLKRVATITRVPGRQHVPAIPAWTEEVADPVIPAQEEVKLKMLAFGAFGSGSPSVQTGLPASGSSGAQSAEGGSTSVSGNQTGRQYTVTEYNGVKGTYLVTVSPGGTVTAIRL